MFNKINKILVYTLILLVTSNFQSCNEIIEKDISVETPKLILPTINDTIAENPVHFKWESMTGATRYRLEVVSPSFTSINTYNLDSVVTGTNFYFDLDSNQYEFRITAMNGAYTSKTITPVPFVVGTSSILPPDPVAVYVTLNTPNPYEYFNDQFNGVFSWYNLSGFATYSFELHDGPNFNDPLLSSFNNIFNNTISSLNGSSLGEGVYSWGVKAFTSSGEETSFATRIFYIDTTPPGNAIQNLPLNNHTAQEGNINFSWALPADAGSIQSPVSSVLQISTNISFSSLITSETTSALSFTKLLTGGTYYWRVLTKDKAGNLGNTPLNYYTLNVLP